jgi:hypothetical protein
LRRSSAIRELQKTNEIVVAASVVFAQELDGLDAEGLALRGPPPSRSVIALGHLGRPEHTPPVELRI